MLGARLGKIKSFCKLPSLSYRNTRRSATSKPTLLSTQRRWLADEAAATQSEPEANGAALNEDADNSISQSSEPLLDPPKTEEQAARAVETASESESKSTLRHATDAATLSAEAAAEAISSGAASLSEATGFGSGGLNRERPETAKPSSQVYVGNLFFDVRGDDLTKEFSRAGAIVNARVVTDQRGLSKGFGYVEFEDIAGAQKAIQMYNQQNFEGRRLSVQFADSNRTMKTPTRDGRPKMTPTRTLFIGNMSFEMSDRDLNELFRSVKNVVDVRVAIDRRTGQPRGFAHADFTDIESAQNANEILNGKLVLGRNLRVDYSHSTGRAAISAS
ncbi:uncharacterized protein KY384_004054 [Bacidia gigantensis]|uniref:uncharacterized protein n=1 Tax=Bacidia gigantensis TaxID=2732470 RepID=UPI001D03D63E|nr:uncharacterized protein KY384_004054 [Bacidia gigantensis]KAG8530698.1 hypothetical protein KY384_004054 [Bacidia gigantensis]